MPLPHRTLTVVVASRKWTMLLLAVLGMKWLQQRSMVGTTLVVLPAGVAMMWLLVVPLLPIVRVHRPI